MLFRPGSAPKPDLPPVAGLAYAPTWESVIETIRAQHPGIERLNVTLYPCASLQVLDTPPSGAVYGE